MTFNISTKQMILGAVALIVILMVFRKGGNAKIPDIIERTVSSEFGVSPTEVIKTINEFGDLLPQDEEKSDPENEPQIIKADQEGASKTIQPK